MANGTPESDFSIECFQNYTAPEVFIQGLAGMVNQTDVETMIRAQKQMLQRFEKTNEMLTNCNALSASRLKLAGAEFKKHTQLLVDMKKDLDYIFKKIRAIKVKLSAQYPEAYESAQKASLANNLCDEDEEFEDAKTSAGKSTKISKELSKSTETLRPSTSQVFLQCNPDTGNVSEGTKNDVQSNNCIETKKSGAAEKAKSAKPKSDKNTDKEKRDSSGSSSSDNTNSCDSSGDCTSDTG